MARQVRIRVGKVDMTATLNDSKSSDKLWAILPTSSTTRTWGREVYFPIPLDLPEENPQARVQSGTIAYWPPGKAFCIFFGQTPYSPVNVLGRLDGRPSDFEVVGDSERVTIERVEGEGGK